MSAGKAFLVGAGPGDPGLLTLRGAAVVAAADVLLYDALVSEAIVDSAPAHCERIFVGKRARRHSMAQDEIEALMVAKARSKKRVVRLKGGDPFVFGRGGEEAEALAAAGIDFEIVPGVTSAIAAPAYAGIAVTHRSHNAALTIATGHEDPEKSGSTLDWASLATANHTLVIMMASGKVAEVAQALITRGLAASTPAAVVENGTLPEQQTAVGTLATIAEAAAAARIAAPAVIVIGGGVALRDRIRWFDRRPLFGKRVLVTRPVAQANELAAALQARGARPITAPTIEIVPPDDRRPAHRAIDELDRYAWVVFTSRNGVDAFFERLASLDADARLLARIKVAAIGSATADHLRRHGVRADLMPAQFISEELARSLIEATREAERVLIFRAQEARDVLPNMLADAGLDTTVVAAYKTRTANDPEFAQKFERADAVIFTSRSTVTGFTSLLGGERNAVRAARGKAIACIGPITAQAAREAGLEVNVTAEIFTGEGIADALESYFERN
ncbi:MAG: uroporphyrinogen-III C-methyltransferase [Candidatus Eremiobacteraeota bacterium]|nr:uroporphyrinogen-III C-methyltransferase [Candidatus Eremiobacteraeota bacterium]